MPELIEPVKENGKLVMRVFVPHRDAKDYAALTGQIVDEAGKPVAAHASPWGRLAKRRSMATSCTTARQPIPAGNIVCVTSRAGESMASRLKCV